MANLPKIQQAQYGDSAKLEQLGGGRLTNNPAASVQQWKDPTGGRPPETDPVKLATRAATRPQPKRGSPSPEAEHFRSKFDRLAELYPVIDKWIALANDPQSGRMTRSYAIAAINSYKRLILKTRKSTPYFAD